MPQYRAEKRTEARMLSATRKRHAQALANQIATTVQNVTAEPSRMRMPANRKSARFLCINGGWGGRDRNSELRYQLPSITNKFKTRSEFYIQFAPRKINYLASGSVLKPPLA